MGEHYLYDWRRHKGLKPEDRKTAKDECKTATAYTRWKENPDFCWQVVWFGVGQIGEWINCVDSSLKRTVMLTAVVYMKNSDANSS